MFYYPFSAIVNLVASICALVIVSRKFWIPLNRCFAYFSGSIAFWSYFYFLWQISTNPYDAVFHCKLLTAASIFIPITFFNLCVQLVYANNKFRKTKSFLWSVAFLLLAFVTSNAMVKGVNEQLGFKYWPIAGDLYVFFLLYFMGVVTWGTCILFSNYRKFSGNRRNQVKYVLLGTGIGFLGGITNYPLWYGIKVPPLGNILVSFYVLLLGVAIARYKLMDLRLAVTKAGVFLVCYLPLLLVPFIVGFKTQNWVLTTSLAVLLTTIGPIIYRFFEAKAEARLLAEQRHYQSTLMQAAKGMVKIRDMSRLMSLITHICSRAVRTKDAYFFMRDQGTGDYVLSYSRYNNKALVGYKLFKEHPLIQMLERTRDPIVIEELLLYNRMSFSSSEREEIIKFSNKFGVSLLVPSKTDDHISAFLTLGRKTRGRMYTDDDITVFNTLAHQAALAIENCQFMEDFQKAQEKVFNAEKLATLGAMASGLSHQLNNRLQAFAAISADLKDAADFMIRKNDLPDPILSELDYMQKGLSGIEENVQHSAQIIRGVLNYARTEKDTAFRELDIYEVIEPSIGLLRVKHNLKDLTIDLDLSTAGHYVYGSTALLSEAVFNLIDNAYEAILQREELMLRKGEVLKEKKLTISTYVDADKLILRVSDNGIGIKKYNDVKMYAPFFTTKSSTKSGTGLGMYVIKRIIEDDHKGRLWYESEYLHGTSFFVELPTKA